MPFPEITRLLINNRVQGNNSTVRRCPLLADSVEKLGVSMTVPSGPENSMNESAVREDFKKIFLFIATLEKALFSEISRVGVFQQNRSIAV